MHIFEGKHTLMLMVFLVRIFEMLRFRILHPQTISDFSQKVSQKKLTHFGFQGSKF